MPGRSTPRLLRGASDGRRDVVIGELPGVDPAVDDERRRLADPHRGALGGLGGDVGADRLIVKGRREGRLVEPDRGSHGEEPRPRVVAGVLRVLVPEQVLAVLPEPILLGRRARRDGRVGRFVRGSARTDEREVVRDDPDRARDDELGHQTGLDEPDEHPAVRTLVVGPLIDGDGRRRAAERSTACETAGNGRPGLRDRTVAARRATRPDDDQDQDEQPDEDGAARDEPGRGAPDRRGRAALGPLALSSAIRDPLVAPALSG